VSPDAASADSAANFDFGGNEGQIPLLDASNFSPFALLPSGRSSSCAEDAEADTQSESDAEETARRSRHSGSRRRRHSSELIRFLIDRTG